MKKEYEKIKVEIVVFSNEQVFLLGDSGYFGIDYAGEYGEDLDY